MRRGIALGVLLAAAAAVAPAFGAAFVNFETGQVRPLALSPAGDLLFAANTPDNRLAIYTITADGLTPAVEVPVGLEPVAVATRTNGLGRTEAWVVNHLSDSVSVVEIDPVAIEHSRVTRTLLVGDEPRDLVFAGPGRNRAFVTAAHRGQNRPGDPQLTTEGIGRADVWVFDATALGAALGGTPVTILELFGDTPRALAVSPDGGTVYAAVFHSGNQTTTLLENVVTSNGGLPPPPPGATPGAPPTGLIVKFDPASGQWRDEINRNWAAFVPFSLPDQDVFTIDANATPPVQTAAVSGVGTVLFNMAVRPDNGKLYVSNTNARNEARFEPLITGNLTQSRITVVSGLTATPHHLNPHIDYGVVPGPADEIAQTLAFPTDMVFSPSGLNLYVAALGSRKVGVLDTTSLEAGSIVGSQVEVGGGPTGLALDPARDRLYVLNRFDQTISIVTHASLASLRAQTAVVPLRFDPSPREVRSGRRLLYDARNTSAHGDQACASCHIFGDFDSLAWDLGDPFGAVVPNPNPFVNAIVGNDFHPMKGPMATQSLRGMADAGPMHWRGDRTGGTIGQNPLDEDLAFKAFNPAFVGLLGRAAQLTDTEMQAFTDFILTVKYPPNPIRALDDVPTAAQAAGEAFYTTQAVDGGNTCNFCHTLPLGTGGLSSNEGLPQQMKVPHLRNAYQKVGMFGIPAGVFPQLPGGQIVGPQVRGAGFLHDASVATVFLFLNGGAFNFGATPNVKRRNVEAFILALDTGLKPAVGQQVSATPATFTDAAVVARINLLVGRDEAQHCDLTVKGVVAGEARGWLYAGSGQFTSDRAAEPLVGEATLRALAATPGQELLYTCVPPGTGLRIALDRDKDGYRDRDELDAGSDPADETSVPGGPAFVPVQTTSLTMKDESGPPADPSRRKLSFKSTTRTDANPNRVVPPAIGGPGDPSLTGATLLVHNAAGSGEVVSITLPASGWTAVGGPTPRYTFRSTDPNGPVKSVTVQADKLQVKGGKSNFAYSLDEPQQGAVAVRLQLGSAILWCAGAQPKRSGAPPSPAKNDRQDRFVAAKKTPAPAFCPNLPPSSPSGAFLE